MIKIESTWRCKIKEQAPQLTLLYRGRSSHRRCCIRKVFLKILQYAQETSVLKSSFVSKRPQHRCFPVNITEFLILPTYIEKHLQTAPFNFFNGSLLHGTKGLIHRLYDSAGFRVRLTEQAFVFKSAPLAIKQVPTCIQNPKSNTFDKSIRFLHWLLFGRF